MNLIQMNEARKQKKLEELTFKLSMDPEVVAQREAEAAAKLKVSLKIMSNFKARMIYQMLKRNQI